MHLCILQYFYFSTLCYGPFCFFLNLNRSFGIYIKMTAIFAHLARYIPDNNKVPLHFKGQRINPRPGISVLANNTVHLIYFFVLKSVSHIVSSGQYAVTTIHLLFTISSATTTWSAFLLSTPTHPNTSQLG